MRQGNHNERPGKISATTRPHATGRFNRGRCLSRTLLSSQLGGLRDSVGNFSILSVLLYFLDFDTSWLHGNFDDASLDRRLVGLSHKATAGSRHPNIFSD